MFEISIDFTYQLRGSVNYELLKTKYISRGKRLPLIMANSDTQIKALRNVLIILSWIALVLRLWYREIFFVNCFR